MEFIPVRHIVFGIMLSRNEMKSSSNNSTLPSDFASLRFVCGCFGIVEKDLAETLEKLRSITKNPNAHFPRRLSREMLAREERGKSRWHNALVTVHREALYERIRRDNGKPLFSFTGKLADDITVTLLTLYERLLPKLDCSGVSRTEALWLLVENVFVPTVFIKLVTEWRYGLGTELQGETCWYLPVKSNGRALKPISRVLDCWLRVAGFRTAYGVSQSLTRGKSSKSISEERTEKFWQTWKKSAERWLNGKPVQSVQRLHRLVDAFIENVGWLDEPIGWKARFTLAFAMQNLCDAMDKFFATISKDSSLSLGDLLRRVAAECIVCDDGKVLAGSHSFFAARLIQQRLQKEGGWEKVAASVPKSSGRSFPPETSDDELAAYRRQTEWQMNPGNWLLEFIKDQAVLDGRLKDNDHSAVGYVALESYIFDAGVIELQRIIDLRRKKAGEQ